MYFEPSLAPSLKTRKSYSIALETVRRVPPVRRRNIYPKGTETSRYCQAVLRGGRMQDIRWSRDKAASVSLGCRRGLTSKTWQSWDPIAARWTICSLLPSHRVFLAATVGRVDAFSPILYTRNDLKLFSGVFLYPSAVRLSSVGFLSY
jgi:hypothetical protein